MPSHIATLKNVYDQVDKYKEGIVKRTDFLLKLRTSDAVVNFMGNDAVRTRGTKPKFYTLDQIITECEKDEMYQQLKAPKSEPMSNDKEFITWSEFESYLVDYKELEDRNRRSDDLR